GAAAVVVAVQAGEQEHVSVAGVYVGGGVGVGNVAAGLRLGVLEPPRPRLGPLGVPGAAGEDTLPSGLACTGHETPGGRAAGTGPVDHVEEDVVPVVRGGRGTRRAQDPRGGVAVELEGAAGEAGGAAGRYPEEVQGNYSTDGDRGGGTCGKPRTEERQEV